MIMDLFHRIRVRSGFLTYSEETDSGDSGPVPERLRWAAELAGPLEGKRVADVGCWTGGLLSLLSSFNPEEIVGVDVSGPWVQTARDRVQSATFYSVESLMDLPSSLLQHFDYVFFLETLEHLPRGTEQSAIDSLAALLVPGGKIILSTPTAGVSTLLDPAWFLVGHRHYRMSTLLDLLTSAGLEISGVNYSGNLWSSFDTIFLYVFKHLLGRRYVTTAYLASLALNGVYHRRRFDSVVIWVEARRPA